MAKKQPPKKPSLEVAVTLLRRRHGGRLTPPLEGLAYRFTIWLPIQAKGTPVFTDDHLDLLSALFLDCFGGFSQSRVGGFPPWSGSWLPAGAAEPIVDYHILLIVYTLQDTEAMTCMRQLKWILQQEQVAGQEVVLIEEMPVHLVEAAELSFA